MDNVVAWLVLAAGDFQILVGEAVESTVAEHALVVEGFHAEAEEDEMAEMTVVAAQHHRTSLLEKLEKGVSANLDCKYLELQDCTAGPEGERMSPGVQGKELAAAVQTMDVWQ